VTTAAQRTILAPCSPQPTAGRSSSICWGRSCSSAASSSPESRSRSLLLGLTRIGVLLVAGGALLVLPFGLWLVYLDHIGYGAGWVVAALALFLLVALIGAIGGQRPKRARRLAARLAREEQPESAELRELLDDRVALALNYAAAAIVLAIIVLMVFRPGAGAD
jgi:uncharacterized membrane protein